MNSVRWVELTLEQSPDELVGQVAHWVRAADQGSGVLLLVDFTSLLSLGELVTRLTGVQVRAVAAVSAPLVIEAVRKAQRSRNMTLDQLVANLSPSLGPTNNHSNGTQEAQHDALETGGVAGEKRNGFAPRVPRVILSVCLTGFGSAARIAELIEGHLPDLRQQGVEIVCMDISLSGKTEADVQRLVGNRHVVAVVGTINPHLEDYPYIALTDFLFGDGIARLRTLLGETLIDPALLVPSPSADERVFSTSSQYAATSVAAPVTFPVAPSSPSSSVPIFTRRADLVREITTTLDQSLMFLNPARAMPLIDRMIELIEAEVGETFDMEVLAGLMLHLACILERGLQKGMLVSDSVRALVEEQYPRELRICRRALHILSSQVARPLPDEEAYNIVGILRQVDIFIDHPAL